MTKQWKALKEKLAAGEDTEQEMSDLDKRMSVGRMVRFFQKNGEFSLTRTILIGGWATGMALYVCGSLFVGATIPYLGLTVPGFDSGNFLSVTGAASSLYFAVHGVKVNVGGAK